MLLLSFSDMYEKIYKYGSKDTPSLSNCSTCSALGLLYFVLMATQSSIWGFFGKTPPPPSKKRKLNDEEKKLASVEYEKTKRTRTYLTSWESKFPWLLYTEGKMFCAWCQKFGMQGKYINQSCI